MQFATTATDRVEDRVRAIARQDKEQAGSREHDESPTMIGRPASSGRHSKRQLREKRNSSISNSVLLDSKSGEEGKHDGHTKENGAVLGVPGPESLAKGKAEFFNSRGSYSSAGGSGRKGQSNDNRAVSLLGQGTSTLQAMQNPQKLNELKLGSLVCSDSKAHGTGKAGLASKDKLGLVSNQGHGNSNSMTKKMFSQMGSNIIQGESSSVGSNSAIRNKPTSHSGMANLQGTQDLMVPVMVKKQNNFMVGSGTQLNSKAAGNPAEQATTSMFNSDSKKLSGPPQHLSAGGSKTGLGAESSFDNTEKQGRGARFQNAATPNGARFGQNGPVKATTVMLQGTNQGADGSSFSQGKPIVNSPYAIEKRVAEIAGIL